MKFRAKVSHVSSCAVCVALTAVVQAAQPIRPISATVNKTAGIVSSFDLTFGTTPAATTLYACYDAEDRGASTNGWAHVEKIGGLAGCGGGDAGDFL